MNDPKRLTILTVLIWSTGQTLGRLLSLDSPFPLFALSFSVAFITFLVYSARTDRRTWRTKLGDLTPSFILFGSLGYFLYWLGIAESIRSYATVSEPIVLNYTWPVFTALFTEFFFRARRTEKPRAAYLVEVTGLGLCFLATLLMVTEGHPLSFHISNGTGLLWGLVGGASYGLYGAFSSTVPREKQLVFLTCSAAVGVIGMAALSAPDLHAVTRITLKDVLAGLALGGLVDGIGYIVWTRVNRLARETGVSISSVASLAYLLPILSLSVAGVSFGEFRILEPYFAVVLVLLTAGSVLCQQATAIVTGRARDRA